MATTPTPLPPPPPSIIHSKKPHFQVPKTSPIIHQIPSKSHSNPLCKTLIIVLLLLAIPLFPSQAPDFITQRVLTQFWEIIHLLFIGVAVSYGLFSRKASEMGSEESVRSGNDDSHAYLSGISHLSSLFEDGFENLCGFDEKDMIVRSYTNSDAKFSSVVLKDGVENVCESNEKKVNQAWKSEYSKGESLVVVSNGKYFLDGDNDFKPLNLPVRSLRSRDVDNDKPGLRNRSEFSPKTDVNGDNDVRILKIRGVTPLNLEKKFDEVSETPSIRWRSRSGIMENGEKIANAKPFVHYRPHSVDEFEFEDLKTRSFRGVTSSSSLELSSSKVENNDSELAFSVSNPKNGPFDDDDEELFHGAKAFEMRNFEHNGNEDKIGKGKQGIEPLDSNVKPLGLAKALSRGKSVRTIKSSRYNVDENEIYPSRVDGTFGRMFKRGRGEEHENRSINGEKKHIDIRNSLENDVELEGSEVDRKAGEFIAKFREQIRFQRKSKKV